jgi:Ca2+-binding EF-hand superfamily protein
MNIAKLAVGTMAVAFVAASTLAWAQKGKDEDAAKTAAAFKHHDKNKDGGLSREEAKKGFSGVYANFDAMDTNKDGKVTLEERNAWIAKQKADKEKKGERKGQK